MKVAGRAGMARLAGCAAHWPARNWSLAELLERGAKAGWNWQADPAAEKQQDPADMLLPELLSSQQISNLLAANHTLRLFDTLG